MMPERDDTERLWIGVVRLACWHPRCDEHCRPERGEHAAVSWLDDGIAREQGMALDEWPQTVEASLRTNVEAKYGCAFLGWEWAPDAVKRAGVDYHGAAMPVESGQPRAALYLDFGRQRVPIGSGELRAARARFRSPYPEGLLTLARLGVIVED